MSTVSGQAKINEIITNRVIQAMAQGIVPWHQPWASGSGLPMRMSSKTPYRGINIWLLGLTALVRGYSSPWWGTFDQIIRLGGSVRKGQNRANGCGSTGIIFFKVHDKGIDPETGKHRVFPVMRFSDVFNAEQAENLPDWCYPAVEDRGGAGLLADPQALLDGYLNRPGGPKFRYAGDRAHYDPQSDTITIPVPESFDSPEARYATEFHEAGHSTGHRSRLNRPGVESFDHFGSDQYSDEELIAEMTAVLLCATSGICTEGVFDNSAAYISNWASKLGSDPRLIVRASSAASKAVDHITGKEQADAKED